MVRRISLMLLVLGLGLAACQPATPTQISATALPTATAPQPPEKTRPAQAEATSAGPAAPPGCTVVSLESTPNPTEQSLFAPVNEKDWKQGPDGAAVTIIEYSDFM